MADRTDSFNRYTLISYKLAAFALLLVCFTYIACNNSQATTEQTDRDQYHNDGILITIKQCVAMCLALQAFNKFTDQCDSDYLNQSASLLLRFLFRTKPRHLGDSYIERVASDNNRNLADVASIFSLFPSQAVSFPLFQQLARLLLEELQSDRILLVSYDRAPSNFFRVIRARQRSLLYAISFVAGEQSLGIEQWASWMLWQLGGTMTRAGIENGGNGNQVNSYEPH